MQKEKVFSVWIGNAGEYSRGNLKGEWAALPMEQAMLESLRKEIGGEEQMAFDYDIPEKYGFLQAILTEYEDPENLNLTAAMLQEASEENLEAVAAYAETHTMNLEELLNVVGQSEDIPYFKYDFEGMENTRDMSPEEKYGYTRVESSMKDLKDMLEKYSMTDYLDYEAIGRDANLGGRVELKEQGYLVLERDNIDLELYTVDELKKQYGLAGKTKEAVQEKGKDKESFSVMDNKQKKAAGPKL